MGKQSKAVQKALKDNNLTSKEKRNLRQEFGQDAVKKAKSKIQPTFDIDLPDPTVRRNIYTWHLEPCIRYTWRHDPGASCRI
jgi:hypothetical protein